MTRWEYRVLDSTDVARPGRLKSRDRAGVEAYLNELGQDGWEIINMDFRELEGRMEFSGVAKRVLTA